MVLLIVDTQKVSWMNACTRLKRLSATSRS